MKRSLPGRLLIGGLTAAALLSTTPAIAYAAPAPAFAAAPDMYEAKLAVAVKLGLGEVKGLLEREKRGVWAYYRLVPSAIATIADLLTPPRKRATKKAR